MASKDAVVTKGLECCLCFELFTEPKLLSCAHTFCKKCLDRLYQSRPRANQINCPICREVTIVKNGDINQLKRNILISSLVEDVKSVEISCTVCDPEAKSPAVQYCKQCDEHMCEPCSVHHGKFKKTAKHDVVSMDDVTKGKVKVKCFCKIHPEEEKLYVCTSCNVSICFRCRVLNHNNINHKIEEVSSFKKTNQKKIESLQDRATAKIAAIEKHVRLVNRQKTLAESGLNRTITEIKQAYDREVQHLTRQRNHLINQCKQEQKSLVAKHAKINASNKKQMSRIRSASELVGNGIKTSLEGQTMAVHNRICCDLQKMLDESYPDVKEIKSISDHANRLKFVGSVSPNLGELKQCDWLLEKVSTFPLSHENPRDAVALSDGLVAIGYWRGKAVEMFTVDGPQYTVLRDVKVYNVSVLSGGRYVVLDGYDNITLYTQAWERRNIQFKTPSDDNLGGMCIDRNDNIYVGYTDTEKIVVFRPEGGMPVRQLPSHGSEPWEICHMNHSKRLVVCDRKTSVSIIDDTDRTGTVLHHTEVDSSATCIAVLKDDSILIACWDANRKLNVKRYTEELEMINTVLSDFKVLYEFRTLVELPTGEIALISAMQFTVFKKSTSA